MDGKNMKFDVEIDVVSVDPEIIDEHLRCSTAVLHDILSNKSNHVVEDYGSPCQHCGKLYKTTNSLNMHYLFKHPDDRAEVKCGICEKKYSSMMSLQKHVRYMHRYNHRCKACYRTFATAEQLFDHELCCSKRETPCEECGKVFESTLALRNHCKYKHPRNMKNVCELCRRTFTSIRSLTNHMTNIHPSIAKNYVW
ncbi:unnamed protein product, partial [Brenthis ino]